MKTNEWLWIGLAVIGTAATLCATREAPRPAWIDLGAPTNAAQAATQPLITVDEEQEALRYGAMPQTNFQQIVTELIRQRDDCQQHYETVLKAANQLSEAYCELHRRMINLQQAGAVIVANEGYRTNGLVDQLEDSCR